MWRAIKVWIDSGKTGLYPADLLVFLDPHVKLDLHKRVGRDRVPRECRTVYVGFDLSRPLEEQFTMSLRQCMLLRDWTHARANSRPQRPGKRDWGRDILVFTLRTSAGRKISEIARDVFPNENQENAQRKVKRILRGIRAAIRRGRPQEERKSHQEAPA